MVGYFTVTTFNTKNITSNGMATKFAYGFGSIVGRRPKINILLKNLLATRYCTTQGEFKKKVCILSKKKKSCSVRQLWCSIMAFSRQRKLVY